MPQYRVEFNEFPFSIKVYREINNRLMLAKMGFFFQFQWYFISNFCNLLLFRFDTSKSSLIFSDQLLQMTTSLSSSLIYGIGENSKETLLHDMNYKTWQQFASQNHPNNFRVSIYLFVIRLFCFLSKKFFYQSQQKTNLYSQFPMYLNVEPDGNSHVVVFYNSNPSGSFNIYICLWIFS